jgi:hypothetical protein
VSVNAAVACAGCVAPLRSYKPPLKVAFEYDQRRMGNYASFSMMLIKYGAWLDGNHAQADAVVFSLRADFDLVTRPRAPHEREPPRVL